jgi:hypothetical protein
MGFPLPIIADEIHIRVNVKEKKNEGGSRKTTQATQKNITWQEIAWTAVKWLGGLIILVLFLPLLYLGYRLLRIALARDESTKADQIYRAALYRFHMAGVERETETPLDYAQTKVDPLFEIDFSIFMRLYLRLKYANATMRDEDQEIIANFAKSIGPSIRKKNGLFASSYAYFNIFRASRYFQTPQKTDYENPSL